MKREENQEKERKTEKREKLELGGKTEKRWEKQEKGNRSIGGKKGKDWNLKLFDDDIVDEQVRKSNWKILAKIKIYLKMTLFILKASTVDQRNLPKKIN